MQRAHHKANHEYTGADKVLWGEGLLEVREAQHQGHRLAGRRRDRRVQRAEPLRQRYSATSSQKAGAAIQHHRADRPQALTQQ